MVCMLCEGVTPMQGSSLQVILHCVWVGGMVYPFFIPCHAGVGRGKTAHGSGCGPRSPLHTVITVQIVDTTGPAIGNRNSY